jgi:hypothetical protein
VPTAPAIRPRTATSAPAIYRSRRPAATILHRTVREHLETFLAIAQAGDDDLLPVRPAAERALREYLRYGIPAHGFTRIRCAACKHEFLVAFSRHMGEDPTPPRVLPARSPPQLAIDFAQAAGPVTWDEVNQTTEFPDDA